MNKHIISVIETKAKSGAYDDCRKRKRLAPNRFIDHQAREIIDKPREKKMKNKKGVKNQKKDEIDDDLVDSDDDLERLKDRHLTSSKRFGRMNDLESNEIKVHKRFIDSDDDEDEIEHESNFHDNCGIEINPILDVNQNHLAIERVNKKMTSQRNALDNLIQDRIASIITSNTMTNCNNTVTNNNTTINHFHFHPNDAVKSGMLNHYADFYSQQEAQRIESISQQAYGKSAIQQSYLGKEHCLERLYHDYSLFYRGFHNDNWLTSFKIALDIHRRYGGI